MSNLLKSTFAKNLSGRASPQLSRRGGAFQAVDMYKRMSQASRKGRIFDDVLRHAKLWAEKQTVPADRFESKRIKREKQQGLF
ncbi:TPA: hypothetical protein LUX75_003685 [Enterobacter hormaechei subsp. xiangfangensis]|uniref:hypothetical protein n=1 Tax=Enterobacter hormaechei TaxID=158836 RepID=UPI001F41C889|nr:hypothetical protein [Enterobacter hormaechei]HBM2438763.1 hypothetical protein [Enterobacter hormaechei subsp. xiangfangensis]ELD3394697.1 hypothetical protein [Enterobacter hormaechei]ELD4125558.1 hypothetical protein [Enterobacter hormaechei]EMB5587698.1 hypothetical protein [Enterobacter hormaechei]MDU3498065.1 hypothetical protein [Enterobacter hormaechei]